MMLVIMNLYNTKEQVFHFNFIRDNKTIVRVTPLYGNGRIYFYNTLYQR